MDKVELIFAALLIIVSGAISHHIGYVEGRKDEHTTLMSVVSFILQTLANADLEEMSDDFEDDNGKDMF